jgi:hypothetical protein
VKFLAHGAAAAAAGAGLRPRLRGRSVKDLNGSVKDLNGSVKDLNGSVKDLNGSVKDLNGLAEATHTMPERRNRMSQAQRRATAGTLAFLTAAAAWGCGSSQAPEAPPPKSAETAQAPASPANRPPEVRSVVIQPWDPVAGQLLTAVADAADPDGDPVRLTYHWSIDGSRYESGESHTLVLPERSKGALVELQVVANDGRLDGQDGETSRARVRVENRPPSLLDLLIEPGLEITVEDELAANARAEDPDRDAVEVRYRWLVNGRPIGVEEDTLTSRHFRRGDSIQLEAVASDGDDESEPLLSPEIHVLNSVPRIVSTPEKLDEDGTFHYTVAVEDADDDRRLRYRLVEGPTGMTLDWLSGKLSWAPSDTQAGTHAVEVEVDDLAGGKATQAFEIQVGFEKPEEQAPAAPQP